MLEGARRDVILVLGAAEAGGRTPIEGWRRSSASVPVPRVNTTAALNVAQLRPRIVGIDLGYGRAPHVYRFYLTRLGHRLYRQLLLEDALVPGVILVSRAGRRWRVSPSRTARGDIYVQPLGAAGFGGVKGRRIEIAGMYDRGWRLIQMRDGFFDSPFEARHVGDFVGELLAQLDLIKRQAPPGFDFGVVAEQTHPRPFEVTAKLTFQCYPQPRGRECCWPVHVIVDSPPERFAQLIERFLEGVVREVLPPRGL